MKVWFTNLQQTLQWNKFENSALNSPCVKNAISVSTQISRFQLSKRQPLVKFNFPCQPTVKFNSSSCATPCLSCQPSHPCRHPAQNSSPWITNPPRLSLYYSPYFFPALVSLFFHVGKTQRRRSSKCKNFFYFPPQGRQRANWLKIEIKSTSHAQSYSQFLFHRRRTKGGMLLSHCIWLLAGKFPPHCWNGGWKIESLPLSGGLEGYFLLLPRVTTLVVG